MPDIDFSEHVAISSNESELQASQKDPRLINVTWFLGRRCNFDCSYCSSMTHDNFSKHIELHHAFNFIDNLNQHCVTTRKKFKITFTGGEPFVHPNFIKILEYSYKKENMYQQGVVTNGSLPLDVYQKAINFLNNITISVHLEQKETDIHKLIDKIIILNEDKNIFLNVNIMALPGKFDQVEMIMHKLSKHSVKFILKKIDPPNKEELPEFYQGNKPKKNMYKESESKTSLEVKKEFKKFDRKLIQERQKQYYNQAELDFFKLNAKDNEWPNIKLHFQDKKILINTEILKRNNLNRWREWICFIGIESLYIEHDGSVYRGICMQGDKLGNISDKIIWPTNPIVCNLDYCTCAADMCTKKVKDKKYLNMFK
jgi:MoaA/NifB/PqqE/SkfB family radical SAM enzyme